MVVHGQERGAQLNRAFFAEFILAVAAVLFEIILHQLRIHHNGLCLEIHPHYVDRLKSPKITDLTLAFQACRRNFVFLSVGEK